MELRETKEDSALNAPTDCQLSVLHAAQMREAGAIGKFCEATVSDCIECGWLTEDYYLTDAAKILLKRIERPCEADRDLQSQPVQF